MTISRRGEKWPSTQSLEEALAPTAPARALDVAQLAIDIPSALAIKPARGTFSSQCLRCQLDSGSASRCSRS